jgi:hypothetical protein
MKKLSAAIYQEQDGQLIVTYSRYKDEDGKPLSSVRTKRDGYREKHVL